MKISSSYLPKTPTVQAPKAKKAQSAPLTENVLSAPIAQEMPFDCAKVEEIKTAIAQGRFKIHPEAIAEGLIQMAKDLIQNEKSA